MAEMDKNPLFVRNPKQNLTGDDPLFVLNHMYATEENKKAYGVSTDQDDAMSRQRALQLPALQREPDRAYRGIWSPFYDESIGPQQVDPNMKPCAYYPNATKYPGPAYSSVQMLQTDWMSCLPDEAPLGGISIPGTNFSMAQKGGPQVQHQSWDIATQLRSGIRYFDLRLFLVQGELVFNNGPGEAPSSIHDFMGTLIQFLKEHPREAVLARVKDAGGGNMAFYNRFHEVLNERYPEFIVPLQLQDVRLGAARGKMTIVKDYYGGPMGGVEYTQLKVVDSMTTNTPEEKDTKPLLRFMKDNMKSAIKSKDFSKLYITAISVIGPGCPYQYAASINEKILFFFYKYPKGRVGIVSIDFPAEHMVNSIIQRNFAPPKKM